MINWTPLVGGCIKSRDFVNFEFILDIIGILNIATGNGAQLDINF